MFDANEPGRLLAQTDEPVLAPILLWESSGQDEPGAILAEGRARFQGCWLLYYGASDSFIGIAAEGGKVHR